MGFLSYLLRVSCCLTLFFAFYLLILRKLTFFKFNRFYLLGALVLSFVIPQLQFTIEREVIAEPVPIAKEVISADQSAMTISNEMSINNPTIPVQEEPMNWLKLLPYIYGLVTLVILSIAILRLLQLLKHANKFTEEVNGLKLVPKKEGFTNCSFFNYVFIDENNLTAAELVVLLRHEEVHFKQFHSMDKLLMMVAKTLLWFNPIVYLYDKALEDVHEFEADDMTSQKVGAGPYAKLLLRLATNQNNTPLIHNFVKSPVKKRIQMLFNHKSKNMKKLMYLLALPIGLGLIWGFTVDVVNVFPKANNKKEFTLILDAGHGGKVPGAEVNGYKEKDIALAMTKKIKALAEAKGINVITTRDNDRNVSLQDRVKIKGDYLLSIHVNSEPVAKANGTKNGIEIYTPSADRGLIWGKANSMQHYLYEQLKTVAGIKTASKPVQQRLMLLQNSSAAGVIIEMGYLTNNEDLKAITDENKQNELAEAIVKGIIVYMDKTPSDEEFDENNKALISPANSVKQDGPFIQRVNMATNNRYKSEQITLNTVNGKPISLKTVYNYEKYQKPSIWVFVNDQLYSEAEALKFDKKFIQNLSENRGYATVRDYDLPALNNDKTGYLFWFGNEPKLSVATAKNRAYYEKYNGTTISGQIVDFSFNSNKLLDGFLVKTTNGETVKANVEIKFTKRIQAMIAKGDQVAIKIYNAGYWKGSEYPVLTSYKLMKDGKLLFDRWPKSANAATKVGAVNNLETQEEPKLLSSTTLNVDVKNSISYATKAKMQIYGGVLIAGELIFDQKNKLVTTKQGSFTDKKGRAVTGHAITFDYKKGTYFLTSLASNNHPTNKSNQITNIPSNDVGKYQYIARDSIRTNKVTGETFLYGNAVVSTDNMVYKGDRIVYNSKKQTLAAKQNVNVYEKLSKTSVDADSIFMNLKTAKGNIYGARSNKSSN